MALTWTIQLVKEWKNYINRIIEQIKDNDGKEFLTNIIKSKGMSASIRDDHLRFLKEIKFIDIENPYATKQQKYYFLTEKGYDYINLRDERKNLFFHRSIYDNIFHYQFCFNCIQEFGFYKFSRNQLHKFLVEKSSKKFGVRLYDRISIDNVLLCLQGLEIVDQDDQIFVIKEHYQLKFNHDKFLEILVESLKDEELHYTKNICIKCLNKSQDFYFGEISDISIEFIYNELINLYKKGWIDFLAGVPSAPIPAAHTLMKWRN